MVPLPTLLFIAFDVEFLIILSFYWLIVKSYFSLFRDTLDKKVSEGSECPNIVFIQQALQVSILIM